MYSLLILLAIKPRDLGNLSFAQRTKVFLLHPLVDAYITEKMLARIELR